jgi:predicted dehydrogenase
MINVAQVGHGYWGPNLLRNLMESPDARLVALCDKDPRVLTRLAEKHSTVRGYTSLHEMLARADVDAVVVATPSSLHHEHALAALRAGKHVMIEKPMTTRLDHAVELVDAAEQAGRILMVGHTFLFNNLVHEVKRRIDTRELGDILYAYSQRLNLGVFRRDADVLWTLAPHDISILNFWFGALPERVAARGLVCVAKETNVAEVAFAQLDYPDGRTSHLHMSWLDPQKSRKMVLVGADKMLVYDDMNSEAHIQIYDKRVQKEFIPGATFADFNTLVRAGDLVVPSIRLREPLAAEVAHFIECVRDGKRPLTDGRHGANVIAVLEAMTRSTKDGGRPAVVNYPQGMGH